MEGEEKAAFIPCVCSLLKKIKEDGRMPDVENGTAAWLVCGAERAGGK